MSKHHPDEHAKVSGATKVSQQDKGRCVSTSHQEMIHESFSKITPHAKDSNKMKRVISATGDFIVQSLQPISIVDDTSFRNLLATADPKIDLPHRTHFSTKVIPEKYVAIRNKVEKQLSAVEYCTITSDLWTASYQNRSYISLTAHFVDSEFSLKSFCLDTIEVVQDHSAQSICDVLSTMFQSWNISHKVFCATTDNAANIVNAASLLGIEHFPCFAHTLQLSVKKALDVQNVRNTIAQCKKLVQHFKHSTKEMYCLRHKQELLQLPQHELIQDCATRWGSTLCMLQQLSEQQAAIAAVLLEGKFRYLMPEGKDWSIIDDLLSILEPFQKATEAMCTPLLAL